MTRAQAIAKLAADLDDAGVLLAYVPGEYVISAAMIEGWGVIKCKADPQHEFAPEAVMFGEPPRAVALYRPIAGRNAESEAEETPAQNGGLAN